MQALLTGVRLPTKKELPRERHVIGEKSQDRQICRRMEGGIEVLLLCMAYIYIYMVANLRLAWTYKAI